MDERLELTEVEARLLLSPWDSAPDDAPRVIENRGLARVEVVANTFVGITFRGVDFARVTFTGAKFVDCRFVNVSWRDANLSDVAFARCSIDDCQWLSNELVGCSFADVRFTKVLFEDTRMNRVRFDNTHFTSAELLMVMSEDGSFNQCAFDQCRAVGFDLAQVQLSTLQWTGGKLSESTWTSLSGQRMTFVGASLASISLLMSSCSELGFERCSCTDVALTDSRMDRIAFEQCTELSDVRVVGGTVKALLIKGGPVDGLYFGTLATEHIIVDDCKVEDIDFDLVSCTKGAQLSRCEVDRLSFAGGSFAEVVVSHCRIGGVVTVEETPFSQLIATEVAAAEGLDLEDAGTYSGQTSWRRILGA